MQDLRIITWQTERNYGAKGQRIAACHWQSSIQHDSNGKSYIEGGIIMADLDRDIEYWIPACNTCSVEIMHRYDNNLRLSSMKPLSMEYHEWHKIIKTLRWFAEEWN